MIRRAISPRLATSTRFIQGSRRGKDHVGADLAFGSVWAMRTRFIGRRTRRGRRGRRGRSLLRLLRSRPTGRGRRVSEYQKEAATKESVEAGGAVVDFAYVAHPHRTSLPSGLEKLGKRESVG